MTTEVEWARLTAPELKVRAAQSNSLVILPVGSLEQHGPHLPVITDTASAVAVSVQAAKSVAVDTSVTVLPGLWLGMSEHHLPFGGTVSLDYLAYRGVLQSIVRSLKVLGFQRLLIVNGHGGNIDPLAVAVRELAVEYDMPIIATTPWMLASEKQAAIFEVDAGPTHACEGESSVMLAIAGDVVRVERFAEAAEKHDGAVSVPSGISRFYAFPERAPVTGTMGDPRSATAQKGEQFLKVQADELVMLIRSEQIWTKPQAVWGKW